MMVKFYEKLKLIRKMQTWSVWMPTWMLNVGKIYLGRLHAWCLSTGPKTSPPPVRHAHFFTEKIRTHWIAVCWGVVG